jgi:hypothetical protein
MKPRIPALALALALASLARAQVTIDATAVPPPPSPLGFPVGGRSPDGRVLSADSRTLTLDGRPWFPVMGEFHFSRYPAEEWGPELLKMKAGGVGIVSTYVFWIHHEETEGRFDWAGQRDLRRFVQLCARDGLLVWVRIGPWAHGEVRNGGFPDWLVEKVAHPRSNDPRYLAYVDRYFGEIGRQLSGLFWKDGGPIVGVQIENEYHPRTGGIEHMNTLLGLARKNGIDAPFVSATGWDRAAVPPTGFLPVFGGYTDQFWSSSLRELPPSPNFFFTGVRAEDNVMGDLQPKSPAANAKYSGYPFLTAEMGAGMAVAYHRRPVMHADDSTAAALVKLGSGIALLGTYMYHGGTNPDGRTPLEETQAGWNGTNDLEAKSYDFQAPLGEFGQARETYRTLKILHLFIADFGSELAPMPAYFPASEPSGLDDASTPRVAARTDGRSGFVFVNNAERGTPLDSHRNFQVEVGLPSGPVEVPARSTFLPSGAYVIWPFNLDVGGVELRSANAEPLCRLADPDTLVFFAWEGIDPQFAFDAGPGDRIEAPGADVDREGKLTIVDGIEPGTGVAIRVARAKGPETRIVVLTHEQALHLWKARLAGRDRLVLTAADASFDGDRIRLASEDPGELAAGVCPALARTPKGFSAEPDGIFTRYRDTEVEQVPSPVVGVAPVAAAAPAAPVRLSRQPRAVATAPLDADFDRAAVWNLTLPASALAGPGRNFLEISYRGDVARLYGGGRLIDDNFYKGPAWEVGAWRLPAVVQLKILPLRADAPIFLESGARAAVSRTGDTLSLGRVFLVHEYDAELDAGP